ncbi:hypothetical protein JKF63_00350 [Porcisia hertigi]|uniref:CRAL-TRIO domain-containing protein n=1 Tax=Porcisia hertigi TaxID=2761500 RepID=A0A836HBG5_9TRYP|nr:hypothetical protein JKF63_00350 [Porcisia hertigi]
MPASIPGEASASAVTTTPINWEAQYERDFDAQKSSGPIVFTATQREKNRELFMRLRDLLPFKDVYKVSDCDLMYRFLIGKHWNVTAAEKGLRRYIEMRKLDHLDSIIGEQLHPTICSIHSPLHNNVPCPIYGIDKEGFPVLWLSPDANKLFAAMKMFTNDQLLRYQLRSMEMCRYVCLQRKVDRCTCVIDLGGVTMSVVNKATLSFLKSVMNLLQVAYPEIMRRLLIFNTGWAVSTAWKVLRPLVDVRVQAKINFESGPPTLGALQEHMTADQVHPSFGGTGSTNVLQLIVDAEVYSIQSGLNSQVHPESATAAASVTLGPSMEVDQSTSLVNLETLTMCSVDSAITSGTSFETIKDHELFTWGSEVERRKRVVVGMPGAVTAWLEKTHAANISLSPSLSPDEYTGCGEAPMTPINDGMAKCAGPGSSRELVPTYSAADVRPAAQPKVGLPMLTISLTYLADGSIVGYCGPHWVGCFRYGLLYAPAMNDDESVSRRFPPPLSTSQQFPVDDGCPKCGMGVRAGELLSEAGHMIHDHLIVCNAHRRARYLLRKSRLRTRLTIYNVVGDAAIHTEKSKRHYLEGQRTRLGVVVPHPDTASCGRKEDWVLYGEGVTKRLWPKSTLPFPLFSKATPVVPTQRSSSGAPPEKARSDSRRASLLTSTHLGGSSSAKGKSSVPRFEGSVSGGVLPQSPHAQSQSGCDMATDNSAQLLAERKGQTVSFYNLLARHSPSDLFALAVAVTQLWNRETGGCKGQRTRLRATGISSDDDVVTQSIS